jgi:pimeloyl-ACP methyl ester carboxylesterase
MTRDVVLIHSLLTDRSAFDPVLPALAERFQLHILPLPKGTAIEEIADSLAREIPDGAAMIGNGYGGTLALAVAARHGARLGKLVLADAAAGFPSEGRVPFAVMRERVGAAGMAAIAEMAARRVHSPAFLQKHPNAVGQRRTALERTPPDLFMAACAVLETVDLEPILASISNPTLVLVGGEDQATPPALVRRVAEGIKGASYVELPGCGHCPMLEAPAAFLGAVLPFLLSAKLPACDRR